MKAIQFKDLLRSEGLAHLPFAESQNGLRVAFMLLVEMLRLTLMLGFATAVLAFNLPWRSEYEPRL